MLFEALHMTVSASMVILIGIEKPKKIKTNNKNKK